MYKVVIILSKDIKNKFKSYCSLKGSNMTQEVKNFIINCIKEQ